MFSHISVSSSVTSSAVTSVSGATSPQLTTSADQANLVNTSTASAYQAEPHPDLRKDATSTDMAIILMLVLIMVYCWARIGKK